MMRQYTGLKIDSWPGSVRALKSALGPTAYGLEDLFLARQRTGFKIGSWPGSIICIVIIEDKRSCLCVEFTLMFLT